MSASKFKLEEDITRVLKQLDKADQDTKDALRTAMYLEFMSIMRESLRQVPVDTGRLRSTAYVTQPTYTGKFKIQAGYATNYAAPVHEKTGVYHRDPTKDHYLTDPFNDALPGMASRIAARAKQLREAGTLRINGSIFKAPGFKGGMSRRKATNKRRRKIEARHAKLGITFVGKKPRST